jgi:translation initiation factor 2B subunit (eIF-2B alpha/beta/delta family)
MESPLALDSISPQTVLLETACDWLRDRLEADDSRPLADRVAEGVLALADAQPAMAALVALGTRLLAVATKAELEEASLVDGRARILQALATWRDDFRAASDGVVRHAQDAIPGSAWSATTTRSSLVERALLEGHKNGRALRVLLSESRPMNEGRGLAQALAQAGVPSWITVDAALPLLLPQAGAVWIGVDAVREKTFITKAGAYGLLLVARELSVPAYALSQRAKFLPDRCARLTLPRRSASEVWADAPPLVSVVNLPFEEVPLALVRGVVTENGFLGPREIADAAGLAPVDERLLAPASPA